MIYSFLSKTRPLNYAVLFGALFIFYVFWYIIGYSKGLEIVSWPWAIAIVIGLLLEMFVLDRTVAEGKLSGQSSFALFFFVLFILLFPSTTQDAKIVFANLSLVLAAYKLLGIDSLQDVRGHIFEASFWICMASLWNEWSLLFFISVFAAIYIYESTQPKNWFVPLLAMATSAILLQAALIVLGETSFWGAHYNFELNDFRFSWEEVGQTLLLPIFLVITIIMVIVNFVKLRQKGGGKLVLMQVLLALLISGMLMSVLGREPSNALVLFFPAALFFSNMLSGLRKRFIVDVFLFLLLLIAFLLLIATL